MCVCVFWFVFEVVCVCVCVSVSECVCVCMFWFVFWFVCVCVCVSVCLGPAHLNDMPHVDDHGVVLPRVGNGAAVVAQQLVGGELHVLESML